MDNLEKIKRMLEKEKIIGVHIGETTHRSETYPVLTIETRYHTIILTLESYNFLSIKDLPKENPNATECLQKRYPLMFRS